MNNYSFSELDFSRYGSFAKDVSDSLRKLIEKMRDFSTPVTMPMDIAINIEKEKEKSRLSDDEWNDLMKKIGGK